MFSKVIFRCLQEIKQAKQSVGSNQRLLAPAGLAETRARRTIAAAVVFIRIHLFMEYLVGALHLDQMSLPLHHRPSAPSCSHALLTARFLYLSLLSKPSSSQRFASLCFNHGTFAHSGINSI